MAPKLRIVFHEGSYCYLERSEGNRVISILKIITDKWMPAHLLSEKIGSRLPALLSTIYKMAGAEKIDLLMNGKRIVIAKRPVLLIQKEEFGKALNGEKNLRAAVIVKKYY